MGRRVMPAPSAPRVGGVLTAGLVALTLGFLLIEGGVEIGAVTIPHNPLCGWCAVAAGLLFMLAAALIYVQGKKN